MFQNKNKMLIGLLMVLGCSLLGMGQKAYAATMYVWPTSQHFSDGAVNTIYAGVNTQGASSNAADMYLSYNPNEIDIIAVRPGKAYEGYLAPQYGGGVAKLSAYSIGSSLNGSATFATIQFRNKPGVTKTSISFVYSPGSTSDSNVADLNSKDILTGVNRGTYTFGKVDKPAAPEKPVDKAPPTISEVYPSPDSEGIPANSVIHFYVSDDDSGVLLKTVRVTVGNNSYTVDNQGSLEFIAYGNNNRKYSIMVKPREEFEEGEPVNVKIEVRDNAGNWIKPMEFLFNKDGTLHRSAPTTTLEGEICNSFIACSEAIEKLKLAEKLLLGRGFYYHASDYMPNKSIDEDKNLHAAAENDSGLWGGNPWLSWLLITLILLAIMLYSYRKMREHKRHISEWRDL